MGLAGGVAFILVFLLIFLPLADFKVAKECSSFNFYEKHTQIIYYHKELMKGTWLLTAYFLCNFSCSLHHCRIIIKGINYIRLHFLQFKVLRYKNENHNYLAYFKIK